MNTIMLQPTVNKPSLVTAIAAMTLASGIVNIFWGLIASLTFLASIIGVICIPITILPTILGIFEVIYAAKLLSNVPQPIRASPTLAAFEIACILTANMFSMIVGILVLIFYNDEQVKQYFAELNAVPAPLPSAPQPVTSSPSEPAAPAIPALPPVESTPAKPEKPKRPRKATK